MKSAKGYIFVLGATIFWGVSATFAKFLFTREIEPLLLVQWRITISALILLSYFLLFNRPLLRVKVKDLYMFALLGILGIAGSNFTYYFTIQQTNVATAILIQYLAPLLVLLYAAVSKEEQITGIKVSAAVISITGCFLAITGKDLSLIHISKIGLITGGASAVCWAFTNVYLRHILKQYQVWTVLIYSFLAGAVFWQFINPPWTTIQSNHSLETWGIFFGIAIVSVLIPHTLYFTGLRYIGASRAIITGTFEPIVAIGSSFIILSDLMAPVQLFGAAMVIGAILILQLKRDSSEEIG